MKVLIVLILLISLIFCRIGGYEKADPYSEEAKNVIDYALKEIQKRSNSVFKTKLFGLVSIERQVVAGTKWRIILEICLDNGRNPSQSKEKYITEIWEKLPYIYQNDISKKYEMVTLSLIEEKKYGGSENADPDSEEAKNVIDYALKEIQKRSNSMFKTKLFGLVSIERQVVAGTKWRITLSIYLDDGKNPENSKQDYVTEIWEKLPYVYQNDISKKYEMLTLEKKK